MRIIVTIVTRWVTTAQIQAHAQTHAQTETHIQTLTHTCRNKKRFKNDVESSGITIT